MEQINLDNLTTDELVELKAAINGKIKQKSSSGSINTTSEIDNINNITTIAG